LWMGIYPSSFTGFFDESVAAMVQHHHAAVATTVRFAQEMPKEVTQEKPQEKIVK